ncbi:MAG: hypothetical protein ACPGVU_14515 [Limisphaerales bacterium]
MKADRLIFLHLIASIFMTGVIWMVQVVHYPLFDQVSEGDFPRFEQSHAFRIGFVVMPPMLIELVTASLLLRDRGSQLGTSRYWLAGITMVIWLTTFLVHMPQHEQLARGFDITVHRELVLTNWARTMMWTLKSFLVCSMLLDRKVIINHESPTIS